MEEYEVRRMIENAIEEFKKSLRLWVYVSSNQNEHTLEVEVRLLFGDKVITIDSDKTSLEVR